MNLVSVERMVEYIMRRKLPMWPIPPSSLNGRGIVNRVDLYRQAAELKARLLSISPSELQSEYAAEQDKERLRSEKADELQEALRSFNRPDAMADYRYWASFDRWTTDEAVTLLMGRDPRRVQWGRDVGPCINISKFAKRYADLRALAFRAQALSMYGTPPAGVVAWARALGWLDIPPFLDSAFPVVELPPLAAQTNPYLRDLPQYAAPQFVAPPIAPLPTTAPAADEKSLQEVFVADMAAPPASSVDAPEVPQATPRNGMPTPDVAALFDEVGRTKAQWSVLLSKRTLWLDECRVYVPQGPRTVGTWDPVLIARKIVTVKRWVPFFRVKQAFELSSAALAEWMPAFREWEAEIEEANQWGKDLGDSRHK